MMYDSKMLREAMHRKGLNFYRLHKRTGLDPKTVKGVVTKGTGMPESAYKVAFALGFAVQPDDLTVILKRRKSA